MNKKHYLKKSIIFIIICIVLISLDQITKYAAVNSLTDNTKVLIKNFLSLELVYNNGAAIWYSSESESIILHNYNYIMYNHRIYIYKAAL